MFSKQVYMQMDSQGMMHQNQVLKGYKDEQLQKHQLSVPITLHSPWSIAATPS